MGKALVTLAAVMWLSVSAYTPYECSGNHLAASGAWCTEGVTVACNVLPFGTRVKVLGHVYTVQDRMAKNMNRNLDIFMESYNQAIQFGRRELPVEVIE
jgi:3D (Asp-Asp-Asp) domain-containing protein